MGNELAVQNITPLPATVEAVGDGYKLTIPNTNKTLMLERDTDFGRIPGTTKPCLFKSGAERIVWAYGITTNFTIESAIEHIFETEDKPAFFHYRVRCEFLLGDRLITVGYGCANSNEKSCGRAAKWDLANQRLKIAKKRALVDGAILIGQLSNMFTQDIENDDFMAQSEKVGTVLGADDPINAKQIKRIYALASAAGISQKEAKTKLADAGFASTKDITQKDYDAVCALFKKEDT